MSKKLNVRQFFENSSKDDVIELQECLINWDILNSMLVNLKTNCVFIGANHYLSAINFNPISFIC